MPEEEWQDYDNLTDDEDDDENAVKGDIEEDTVKRTPNSREVVNPTCDDIRHSEDQEVNPNSVGMKSVTQYELMDGDHSNSISNFEASIGNKNQVPEEVAWRVFQVDHEGNFQPVEYRQSEQNSLRNISSENLDSFPTRGCEEFSVSKKGRKLN